MVLNVIPFVHDIINKHVAKDDICIDATCGNGHDTLLLCQKAKYVYGFDVQDQAIVNTEKLLNESNLSNYKLLKESHEHMSIYVKDKVKVITFNLGYLPGSDKTVQTNSNSTINAINDGISLLAKNGFITIILYIGHEGGLLEAKHVEEYVKTLDKSKFRVVKYDFINRKLSPYVIIIEKQ